MPDADDSQHPVAAARQRVDHQIRKLGIGSIKETAILDMLISRESAESMNHAAQQLVTALGVLQRTIDDSTSDVVKAIDAFTKATDASSQKLAKWTKWMAFATIALAFFAVVQIIVAVLSLIRTPG